MFLLEAPLCSLEDVRTRHELRWRSGMEAAGLDPDVEADKFRTALGFWFDIAEEMRRDYVTLKGEHDELSPRRKRPDTDAILAAHFRRFTKTVCSFKVISDVTGLSEAAVRAWVISNPGCTRKVGHGLYELRDTAQERRTAPRAVRPPITREAPQNDEMTALASDLSTLMGHGAGSQ